MFVRSTRESPSVVSTRVLRTHRKNSVENFRLQERVKTIDFESKHNYSQISDEIDGVRQNLVKIKGVKKNVGVSVERRKLLRDKGLRILPVKHNDKDDYFKVRTPQGKDVIISCSDFYDGETMRKRLSIDVHGSARTPCLDVENSDGEELLDSRLPEIRNGLHTISLDRPFRYRNITPPLQPGSRRNFKDLEEKNSEEEKLLEKLSSMERKYGILRPQTAYLRERDRQASPRPRSRTCPAEVQSGETTSAPCKKISRKNSGIVGNTRKKSRGNPSVDNETSTTTKTTKEQMLQAKGNQQEVCLNTNVVLEETIPLSPRVRPGLRARSMTVGSGQQTHSGISRTVVAIRRMSLDVRDKSIRLLSSPSGGRWFQPDTPEFSPINEDNEKVERKLSKFTERKVSSKDNLNDDRKSRIDESSLYNGSPTPSTESFAVRDGRKESVISTKSRTSCDVRAQSAPHSRLSSRRVIRRSSHNFAYDAQPDKALTKGYVTMQMTIGNKQVKVYVPKFSTDCLDDVVERARAKSAVKAVGIRADR